MTRRPDSPPPTKHSGLLHLFFALKHSVQGIQATLRAESAFRQEVAVAAIAVPVAALLPVTAVEHAMLIASVLLVLLVELLNSAIEAAIDRISLDRHELSGRAKDCGSAAVAVALLICIITWGLLCGPLLIHWLSRH